MAKDEKPKGNASRKGMHGGSNKGDKTFHDTKWDGTDNIKPAYGAVVKGMVSKPKGYDERQAKKNGKS